MVEEKRNETGDTKGILRPGAIDRIFTLVRHEPSDELACFMEHYWIVRWDLRGCEPYESETLPFPSVHAVVEKDRADVWGVVTGRFTRRLEGEGRAFGMKFRPGAFRAFVDRPVSEMTDRIFPVAEIFGDAGAVFVRDLNFLEEDREMVKRAEEFIVSRKTEPDKNIEVINRIVEGIISERSVTGVEQIVNSEGIGMRSLQRLFSEYVGVGPKWVIKRYRLQEAADRLARGEKVDLTRLALDLGYFDQAHFIKDFKGIIGRPPGEYARNALSIG